ncbi:hypothetical protein [Streptosporangium sp. LJ11]
MKPTGVLTAGGRPPAPGGTITPQRTVTDDDGSETVKRQGCG